MRNHSPDEGELDTVGSIVDCYAMIDDPVSSAVWIYKYDIYFGLVRFKDGKFKRWKVEEYGGSSYFLVDDSMVLFFGQYGERDAIFKMSLEDDKAHFVNYYELVFEDGSKVQGLQRNYLGDRLILVDQATLDVFEMKNW